MPPQGTNEKPPCPFITCHGFGSFKSWAFDWTHWILDADTLTPHEIEKFCHGNPEMIQSLLKVEGQFSQMRRRIGAGYSKPLMVDRFLVSLSYKRPPGCDAGGALIPALGLRLMALVRFYLWVSHKRKLDAAGNSGFSTSPGPLATSSPLPQLGSAVRDKKP